MRKALPDLGSNNRIASPGCESDDSREVDLDSHQIDPDYSAGIGPENVNVDRPHNEKPDDRLIPVGGCAKDSFSDVKVGKINGIYSKESSLILS